MSEKQDVNVTVGSERSKKLTIKQIVGATALTAMPNDGSRKWLCDVYCYVTGSKLETSTFGDYQRWQGEFKSENLLNGEILISSNAIFPAIVSDIIEAAYNGGNKIGGASGNVMLALRVGIKHGANKSGYEWTTQPIVAVSGESVVDRMMADAKASAQVLLAPPEAEKDTQAEPSKAAHVKK